jgi:transposase-like protein
MSRKATARTGIPDPEVVPTAKRRRFSAAYKSRILDEADACTEPGEIGALLRREGIFSSYLTRWRREREQGQSDVLKALELLKHWNRSTKSPLTPCRWVGFTVLQCIPPQRSYYPDYGSNCDKLRGVSVCLLVIIIAES